MTRKRKKKEERFAYEEAKAVFDTFAEQQKEQYKRAYQKFLFMTLAYAYIDSGERGVLPTPEAISRAWEDVQIAVTGHGDACLTGSIIQLWLYALPADFGEVIKEAFAKAEAATSPATIRRYMAKHRDKPIRTPAEGFTLPHILPLSGITVRDWAIDKGHDYAELLEQMEFVAEMEAGEMLIHVQKTSFRKPKLTLVKSNGA